MLQRCYSAEFKKRNPTYLDCIVVNEWLRLSVFEGWMLTQDWKNNQLDKDILLVGNKIYSPETCVFISRQLNSFILETTAKRGEHPLGVSWHAQRQRYQVHCKNPFSHKREYIGLFNDPNEAHNAWKIRKHQHALIYAEQQTDPRVADALRTRYL